MQLLSFRIASSGVRLKPEWLLILATIYLASCAFRSNCSASAVHFEGARPVLFYTDLDSGPATGGENGVDGAFVCVYGENFGYKRGTSQLLVGGVEVAAYKLWNDAGAPYHPGNYAKILRASQSLDTPRHRWGATQGASRA